MCDIAVQVQAVKERDNGFCSICGADTIKIGRIFCWINQHSGHKSLGSIQLAMRFNKGAWQKVWNMDHITPVSKGGGVTPGMTIKQAMTNLRTLCVPCHKDETAKLAADH